jgi:hypothetical protein
MKRLVLYMTVLTGLGSIPASAQSVRRVDAYQIVPPGDYITQPGVPGCSSNPFDAVQAAGNVIAGAQMGGWTGALVAVLDAVGRSGKVGGAAGDLLQVFYGPRYASCAPVSVVIPAGSRIVGYAWDANDGVAGEKGCPRDGNGWQVCEIGWSLFEPPQITPAGDSIIVTSIFKNWSHDRERGAGFHVDFIPPQGY